MQDAVEGLEGALEAGGVFLVFEGGQFIWPGIEIGFERRVSLAPSESRSSSVRDQQRGRSSSHRSLSSSSEGGKEVIIRTLALQPLVVEIEQFLSIEECNHVIAEATPHMAQSKVALMDKDKGRGDREFRTSETYFMPSRTSTIQRLDDRVASLVRVPRQHQEYVQVLRYGEGAYYGSHHDYWDPDFYQSEEWLSMSQGGFSNRLATVFWYMSDVSIPTQP
jgi:prolyl 4-hydroxylase